MPYGVGQEHDHPDGTSAFERLSDDLPRIRGFNRVEHVLHLETGGAKRLRQHLDGDRRRAALPFELQINDARHFSQRSDDLIPGRVERVQIIAEYLDCDLRSLTAQALADAIAEEGDDFALYSRVFFQDRPQFLLGRTLIHRRISLQFDMKFAAVGTPSVLAQFRAADLLLDALHIRQGQHIRTDALADVPHLLERTTPYCTRYLQNENAFL